MAACLQDHKRAVIVGERTVGRGGVQNLLNFKPTGGQLRITTAVFLRPSGKKLHRIGKTGDDWGVKPDVVARAERQMDEALRCLVAPP